MPRLQNFQIKETKVDEYVCLENQYMELMCGIFMHKICLKVYIFGYDVERKSPS